MNKPLSKPKVQHTPFEQISSETARFLDRLPGMIACLDSDLRYLYVNRNYAERHDLSVSWVIGRRCEEAVSPAYHAVLKQNLGRVLAGENATFSYEMNGQLVQADCVPDRRDDGSVAGVILSLTTLSQPSDLQSHIAASRALFGDAFEHSPIGMALVDTLGRVVRANDRFAAMLGRTQAELVNLPFAEITHPEDINADMSLFREVLAGTRDGYKIDKRYIRGDGAIVEAALTVTAIRNRAGQIIRFISQIEDVTEQRQAERKLLASHAQLSLAMEAVPGGFWHMEIASQNFETSERLAKFISGRDGETMHLPDFLDKVPMEDRAGTDLSALVEGRVDRSTAEYRLDTNTGLRWVRCDRRLLRDTVGKPYAIVGVVIDFTEEREKLIHSQEQAHTDALTGLLNRRGLLMQFGKIADRSAVAVLAVDLDGFKAINDTIGHDAGDAVLVETAAKLRSAVRAGDLIARLGGDEFAIVLREADHERMQDVGTRITKALRQAMAFGEHSITVHGSVGGAMSVRPDATLDTLLKRADERLYKAKASGKDNVRTTDEA